MRLWRKSISKRAAVELDSDNEKESESNSTGHSSRSSSTVASAPQQPVVSPRPTVPPLLRSAEGTTAGNRASAAPAGNRFTSSAAAPRAIAGPGPRPMIMGMAAQPLTVHAIHQRAQSAQQLQRHSSVDSSANNDLAMGTPRAQSARSSRGNSFVFATQKLERYNTMNVLVLGAPQVGKSLFINSYRAAVTNTTRWPAAPVGVSGFYGTTTVEPFPNHPREPTWLCIDTPGRLYNAENEVILEKLTEGMPWKTKLVGPKSLTLSQVEDLTPIAANKAHQCVLVIPATDLIEDEGWLNVLLWRNRYRPTEDVAARILYMKQLTSSLRALMNDASPFVVVTKMDKFGGAGCSGACAAITSVLRQCVPVNRIYFTAAVENRALLATGRAMVLESSTKQNLVRLHEDICFAVQWRNQMENL